MCVLHLLPSCASQGGAATRIRGLDCRCRPVSVWPIFEDALSNRASLQHSVNVALCQSDSPAALDWFDRSAYVQNNWGVLS